ncbi:outer-membrane lipoprotein carrier protein LolA [Paludisphaera borealis]|uniref:Outer-membrane lipoprotein carrier protein n=1 Tax=Paludisphaera borealis TaxID=1387353 RepID=A0A1U7CN56_9BACT|nr:outer-membrane lipoprotein carrier protein LolA [Paludisphaera borealis]APW60374.1 Outer-membrane lipoprotein carrier protein [Paludisphaera borealis]
MGRGATIRAGFLAAVCTAGAPTAFGQAPKAAPAAPKQAQPAAAQAKAAPADPAKMERLLVLWEKQSSLLKTLDAKIFRRDYIVAWEEYEYFEGRAIFKNPNLAYIDFRKIQQDKDKKPVKDPKTNAWVSAPKERIICTGNEVWQYDSDTKQIIIYPLDKDQAAKALEEGPLPFLFNMKADDAKRRYNMTLISEDEKTYGISVRPKLEVDQESFSQAFVQLDRKYLLPVRIILHSPDGKSQKDFQLSGIKPNAKIEDDTFQGKTDASWKVVRNPDGDERPRAGVAGGQRRPAPAAARNQAAPKR